MPYILASGSFLTEWKENERMLPYGTEAVNPCLSTKHEIMDWFSSFPSFPCIHFAEIYTLAHLRQMENWRRQRRIFLLWGFY